LLGIFVQKKNAVAPPGPGEQQESMVFIENLSGYGGKKAARKASIQQKWISRWSGLSSDLPFTQQHL
jgi:hypothetical protein